MGAAATGTVSGNRARKEGKRYRWGAERPSVIERRVQLRKKQIDIEIAQIREEVEKKIARRVAAKEAERLKVLEQEALLEEHREKVRKSRASRRKSRYVVPEVDCTSEEIAAVMAENPGADEEVARLIIHKRRAQAGSLDVSHADAPAHEALSSPSGSIA